jgi:hypothetical protein
MATTSWSETQWRVLIPDGHEVGKAKVGYKNHGNILSCSATKILAIAQDI